MPLLDWPGAAGWNASTKGIWMDPTGNGLVSGYTRSFANLNHVIVRGGGHMSPFDQPARSLDLITRFVEGTPFA